jgi:hypothetical protein
VAGLAAIGSFSGTARAQQGDGKPLAEALFQDGRNLLEAGEVSEACAKFVMSQRIEPKLGTLLNVAACHELQGKTASAWAEFTESISRAARSNQPEREAFAREHADRLSQRLSRITITLPQATTAVSLSIDAIALDGTALRTAFPVDPGEHSLSVDVQGKKTWTQRVTIPQGPALTTIVVPPLVSATRDPVLHALPQRTREGAWIALGASALAFGAGTLFGVRALALKSAGRDECSGTECSQRGLDLYQDATTSAHLSTVSFAVALVAAGIGVYFLARPERH